MPQSRSQHSQTTAALLEKGLDARIQISQALVNEYELPPYLLDRTLNPQQTTSFREIMISKLITRACMGSEKATQEILDRLGGKPSQYVESHSTSTTYIQLMEQCLEADYENEQMRQRAIAQDQAIEDAQNAQQRRLPNGFDEEADEDDALRDLGLL